MCRWLSGQQRVPGLLCHSLRRQAETEEERGKEKNGVRYVPFISCPSSTKTSALSECRVCFLSSLSFSFIFLFLCPFSSFPCPAVVTPFIFFFHFLTPSLSFSSPHPPSHSVLSHAPLPSLLSSLSFLLSSPSCSFHSSLLLPPFPLAVYYGSDGTQSQYG